MFTRRFSNALLISLIVHLIVLLAFTQQWTIGGIGGGEVRGKEKAKEQGKEKEKKEKVVEIEFGKRFVVGEPVVEAVERYALKKLAIAPPVERPVTEALTRSENVEFIPEAVGGAPAPAEVPKGVITTTRPPIYGGGGGLPIAKFVQSMSYVPPTTTAIRYSGPGMTLALARPGMNIRVPAGLPVTRGTSPGFGPGKIPGVGGIGPGGGIGRGVSLPTTRITRFAPVKVGGEGISIGGLAGEMSEVEMFALSEEPGAILIGRGRDVEAYIHLGRLGPPPILHPDPMIAPVNLVDWCNARSKIKMKLVGTFLRFTDNEIMKYPILLWFGERNFFRLSDAECRALKEYLEKGGFIFVDSGDDTYPNYASGAFSISVRDALRRALGADFLKIYRVPNDDPMFKCLHEFNGAPPGEFNYGFIEAIDINGRRAVVLSENDYNEILGYTHSNYPNARELVPVVFRFVENIMVYALKNSPLANTKNYLGE